MPWRVLALSVVLAGAIAVGGLLAPAGSGTALGAATTLTIISGEVEVRQGRGDFALATDGVALKAGDTIRTGEDARAVITYFEGSTVTIEPNSELFIESASSGDDGSITVVMVQYVGRTWHVVSRLISGSSRYEIRSPASIAAVRGTAFEFGVSPDGTTEVTTTAGKVATADAAQTAEVVVAPGQTTTVNPGEPPAPPRPAPEPVRRVTVNVGAVNTLVVDPLGRTNGVKDGKVILQTPGAQVTKSADGKLAIVMPNTPDGKVGTAATKKTSAPVAMVTTVEEKGRVAVVQEVVRPGVSGVATSGVEVGEATAVVALPDGAIEKSAREAAERAAREAAARATRAKQEAERAEREAKEKAARAADEAARAAAQEKATKVVSVAAAASVQTEDRVQGSAEATRSAKQEAEGAAKVAAERAEKARQEAGKAAKEASERAHDAREAAAHAARDAAVKALKEARGAKKPVQGRR